MNIGDAARRSGVSAKMIRHYEQIGLIQAADRTAAGYRTYTDNDVHRLQFIKHARTLGFSIVRIKSLLALWDDKRRASGKVQTLAKAHIDDLQKQIDDMRAMVRTLERLVHSCHDDTREDCPILEGLAAPVGTTQKGAKAVPRRKIEAFRARH